MACLAAKAATVPPAVTMTSTFSATSSPASAEWHRFEKSRGMIQRLGLAPILCEGTPLAPTLQCAIYDPNTETYFNPYTEDGSSPGLLGLDSLLGLL